MLVLAGALALAAASAFAGNRQTAAPVASTILSGGCSHPVTGALHLPAGDGSTRADAIVHVPSTVRGRRVPLLVALHGAYGSGAFMQGYSGLSAVADREGFVVVYPSALAKPAFWDLTGARDIGYLRHLVARVQEQGCIDDARTYAVGVSNGGGMTARLGCELSDELAAIVVVAGGFKSLPPCTPDRPLSVLEIHGTDDRVVPYNGDPGDGNLGSVWRWLGGWIERDDCHETMQRLRPAKSVVRARWVGCAQGTSVEHLQLLGGQHAWPGATPPDPGPRNQVSAAEETWAFLRDRRRTQPFQR